MKLEIETMKEKILDILEKHYFGRNHIENKCADEILGLVKPAKKEAQKTDFFTIATSPETAEKIRKQCESNEYFQHCPRSYKLGKIKVQKGLVSDYALVEIIATEKLIKPSDIFFLGFFAADK